MRHCLITWLFLVLTLSAKAQQAPSWLHPPETTLRQAVDDGFALKGSGIRYHSISVKAIPPHSMAKIAVIILKSPLVCAFDIGASAARNLRSRPLLEEVKQACDGKVMAIASVRTKSTDEQWRILLRHGATTLEPWRVTLDENPHKTRYNGGLMFGEIRGYRYQHIFHFAPPEPWAGSVTVLYTDGFHPGAANANFSQFAADELKYRK